MASQVGVGWARSDGCRYSYTQVFLCLLMYLYGCAKWVLSGCEVMNAAIPVAVLLFLQLPTYSCGCAMWGLGGHEVADAGIRLASRLFLYLTRYPCGCATWGLGGPEVADTGFAFAAQLFHGRPSIPMAEPCSWGLGGAKLWLQVFL